MATEGYLLCEQPSCLIPIQAVEQLHWRRREGLDPWGTARKGWIWAAFL